MSGVLSLRAIEYSQRSLWLGLAWNDVRFSTTYWYQDVDFHELVARHGQEQVLRLLFHMALFEINKLASLKPERLRLGAYGRFFTAELEALWRTVFRNVWAEWRYENDEPDYRGPAIESDTGAGASGGAGANRPFTSAPTLRSHMSTPEAEILALCGGGKDSLVAIELLRRAGVAFDTLVYSSSTYGPAQAQHALADRLLDSLARAVPDGARAGRRRRQWIYDDFMDSPVLRLHPEIGVRTLTAAETPSSVFAALPIALAHGYRYISLGHERSANTGQVHWPVTGEEVNHQWGKSFAAESLINQYIGAHLMSDVTYFSLLAPIYDVVIFGLLTRSQAHVPFTHSCNLRKPWCLACAKCLYVWLGYAAFLPRELVRRTFGHDDLFARTGLAPMFRELLGLDGRQPFECIGQADEARLYLALCWCKGYREPMVLRLVDEAFPGTGRARLDQAMHLAARYLELGDETGNIPANITAGVGPQLRRAIPDIQRYIAETLAPLASE